MPNSAELTAEIVQAAKTVQAILRHGTIKETQDSYIKKASAPTARALEV